MLRFRLALFATLLICSKAFSISFRSDKTSALEAAKRTPSKLAFDGGKGSYETHPVQGIPISSDFVGDAALPTPIGSFRMRAYRVPGHALGLGEICVIYSAQHGVGGEDVPVRVHDQCLTAEVFGSQRCDSKEQLEIALQYIHEHGGCLIYMQQEGRGIGLANKVAAYALQEQGFDTVEANLKLGLPEDAREYNVIPGILHDMNITSIRLMTNNPRKAELLQDLNVQISGTIPVVVPQTNVHNREYMETKLNRMNHMNLHKLTRQATNPEIARGGSKSPEASEKAEDSQGVLANDDGYCFGAQSVVEAIDAIQRGEMVVVVDDMNRENEGDFIMAADLCTPMKMAEIVRYSSGVVCIGMEGDRLDHLGLPAMLENNEDPKETAFSITVDATKAHGISTGISATDRAKTMNLLADPSTIKADFNRPGHIFPLRARLGGVLERDGHTEASVDLCRLAGLNPAGVLCEIVSEENPREMMRLPEIRRFCKKHGYVLTSIVDLQQYLRENDCFL